jgi:hypothetical protein
MADEQQPVSFDNAPPTSTQDTSQILPKPVETGSLFPVASHDHDGVNSLRLPAANLLGEPMYKLADVTTNAAATSIDSGTIAVKNILKVYLFINSRSASTNVNLQFNGDTGSNYNWRVSISANAPSTNASASKIGIVDPTTGSTDRVQAQLEIINLKGQVKTTFGSANEYVTVTSSNFLLNQGIWNNEDDQITSIKVLSDSTQTFGALSRLLIYGM